MIVTQRRSLWEVARQVFEHPNCRRRLAELSTEQLRELMAALIWVRPRCAALTDELLIALDRIGRP